MPYGGNDWHALTTEPILEPDLPICDPHHHFWDAPHRGQYFLPDLLADIGGGHNIVSTVFLECQSMFRALGPEEMKPLGEIEFVRGIAAQSDSGQYGGTRVAEGIVGTVHDLVTQQFAATYGRVKDQNTAILAMGKLGSREMTAASDLDLILIYDFDHEQPDSDGERSLHGAQYFARFTQRLISAFTTRTNYGVLYDVDMRLRPSGRSQSTPGTSLMIWSFSILWSSRPILVSSSSILPQVSALVALASEANGSRGMRRIKYIFSFFGFFWSSMPSTSTSIVTPRALSSSRTDSFISSGLRSGGGNGPSPRRR